MLAARRLSVGLGVLVLVAAPLSAQAPRRPVSVGLGGGATLPIGDFASDTKTGWHGTGFVQYEPAANVWGVRGEASFHRQGYTDEFRGAVNADPDDDISNSILHVGASALLLGRKRDKGLTPYLIGGLGMYRLTASLNTAGTVQSNSENGFGFNAGAGIRLGRDTGMYLEARFHQFSITTDVESTTGVSSLKSTYQMIPVTLGIRF